LTAVDLVFAVLFWRFLRAHPPRTADPTPAHAGSISQPSYRPATMVGGAVRVSTPKGIPAARFWSFTGYDNQTTTHSRRLHSTTVTHQTACACAGCGGALRFIGEDVAEVAGARARAPQGDSPRAAQVLLHGLSDDHASGAEPFDWARAGRSRATG
jgi:hypothetical protein